MQVVELEAAESQHVDDLELAAGFFVQLFEQVHGPLVLFDLEKVLSCRVYGLALILLPVVYDPLVYLEQLNFCTFEVVSPHLIVGDLQLDIDTKLVHLDAFFHRLLALGLSFLLLNEISQTHFSYACVSLSNISLDLCFRGG